MKKYAIAVTTIAIVSGVLARGTFSHAIVVLAPLLYIGIPLAVVLILWLLLSVRRGNGIPSSWTKTSTITAMIAAGMILSLCTGKLLFQWEIRSVRLFVAATIPSLDEYYKKNGAYPKTLAELGISEVPSLLQNPGSYSATTDSFSFIYADPSTMMGGCEFPSSERKWRYFD